MQWIRPEFKLIEIIRENFSPETVAGLKKNHIHTLEDLIALWEIEGLQDYLARAANLDLPEMERLVAESQKKIDLRQMNDMLNQP